ncbi:hypothetical protein [Nocardioides panzhihuensis]|uniref:Uncharacterized protein n=1 Tax=Nocardioides panzhihuensis TaxID=860243 RepID=A0A7Z0DJT1_9ACTN|nr:hypothetical protein [Nocardioides panzhihuensis]NYI76633.1 hypothetical protein [Nocardioides panzhihuensis]
MSAIPTGPAGPNTWAVVRNQTGKLVEQFRIHAWGEIDGSKCPVPFVLDPATEDLRPLTSSAIPAGHDLVVIVSKTPPRESERVAKILKSTSGRQA